MSTITSRNAIVDIDAVFAQSTEGADDSGLLTIAFVKPDCTYWNQAIHEMMSWRGGNQFDADDQPSPDVIDSAIQFACHEIDDGGAAPDSIVPSGAGRIAMEWNCKSLTYIIEFIGNGYARLTIFYAGKFRDRRMLIPNPATGRLEARG